MSHRSTWPRLIAVAGVFPAALAFAQAGPPATDVFLAPLAIDGDKITVGTTTNISADPGYDNQPSFLPDASAVLFTSGRDGKQTDIYRYDVAGKKLEQLTHTDENEYSPLVAADWNSFTCVRGAEQSLYRFDLDGSHPRLAYQHGSALIGYYVWTGPNEVATFILGDEEKKIPHTLQVIDTGSGKAVTIASDPGRSLLRHPGTDRISFVSKATPEHWQLQEFDIKTHAVTTLTEMPKDVEDLAWLPDGRVLAGKGSKLFVWKSGAAWAEVADLSGAGIGNLTRLAVSSDGHWLALVGEPGNKE